MPLGTPRPVIRGSRLGLCCHFLPVCARGGGSRWQLSWLVSCPHVEDHDGVPGSRLWPSPALLPSAFGGWTNYWQVSVCLSLCLPCHHLFRLSLCLWNEELHINFWFFFCAKANHLWNFIFCYLFQLPSHMKNYFSIQVYYLLCTENLLRSCFFFFFISLLLIILALYKIKCARYRREKILA